MLFNFKNTYTQLPSDLFSHCNPDPVSHPQLVVFNEALAVNTGIDFHDIEADILAGQLSGNLLPDGSAPIAQAYSGHQFGHFTRLGDGRAVLLGEHQTPDGRLYDIQLKGSGITPYSRRGDGRATLSSMLREYIISEAMHALGIPTTRSLAVVATGDPVYREQIQPGAVLTRVAASHIRVGTFEHASRFGGTDVLEKLVTYVINRHYPELERSEQPAIDLLKKVMEKQITLIVDWMRVGFIHGVMNTDNMTLSGETIDYGPCAFMNTYNPKTVFSSIDTGGRYSFENQPGIALWNLTRLAESLLPLIHSDVNIAIEQAENVLNTFGQLFEKQYAVIMGRKLGIEKPAKDDNLLLNELLNWMYLNKADYTNTFLHFMYPGQFNDDIYQQESFTGWKRKWMERINASEENIGEQVMGLMQQANPVYIPRNHRVEEVLTEVTTSGNTASLQRLMTRLEQPYSIRNLDKDYCTAPSPELEACYKTFCGT